MQGEDHVMEEAVPAPANPAAVETGPALPHAQPVLFPVLNVRRTPGGNLSVDGDPILGIMRGTRATVWRPAETPDLQQSPAASSPVTPRSNCTRPEPARRRLRPRRISLPIYDNLNDSGSELEGNENEEDDEDAFEHFDVMRAVSRQLQVDLEHTGDAGGDVVGGYDGGNVGGGDGGGGNDGGGDVRGGNDGGVYVWSQDFATFQGREEEYTRTPGPSDAVTSQDPVDLFMLVWDRPILEMIVEETNRYAWQTIAALSETDAITENIASWHETTVSEMYRYMGILMFMALNPRGNGHEYWTTSVLGMPEFRLLMARNRFQMLSRFVHFVDNDFIRNDVRSYERKVAKILPLVDHCNAKFSEIYTPNKQISLDESLLLWKGRLSWVQCIRTKAARFGIKSFEVCEATTGYMLRIIIYAGKNSAVHDGPIHGFTSSTAKVVLKLMEGYLDVGHCLVMDNWYNQLPLTRFLKQRRTDVMGTLNRRRRHVPALIKNVPAGLPRGESVSCHSGDLSLTVWKDVKLVTTISTYHRDEMVPGRRAGEDMNKPESISDYNKYMGGVDLKDQKLSMYLLERKRGHKWYVKVFRRLLNISILNTFIVYQHQPVLHVLSHRQYRYRLAEGLMQRFPKEDPARPLRQQAALVRLDRAPDHYPVYTEPMASKPTQRTRRRCARCSARGVRTQVTTICRKCQTPLCLDICWIQYHTLDKL